MTNNNNNRVNRNMSKNIQNVSGDWNCQKGYKKRLVKYSNR